MARQKRTAPEPEEQTTALALPDAPILVAAYGDDAKMDAILTRIETDALSIAPDLSTASSRKEIASLAFKVARSKTALDEIGKTVTEDARKRIDAVNAKRRDVRERLDTLKVRVRAPLDEWEAAEAARVADLEDRLKDFSEDLPGLDAPSAEVKHVIGEIEAIPIDDTWAEFKDRAQAAKTGTLNVLRDLLEKAKVREAERAELERLRAEAAAREEEDRRRQAEERRKAEAARIEQEKAEAAERAARAAEERAARAQAEAEARHQRELAAAAERERLAVEAERKRIADEQARAEAARKAREADEARRAQVRSDIWNAIEDVLTADMDNEDPASLVTEAIMAGRIPHVKAVM